MTRASDPGALRADDVEREPADLARYVLDLDTPPDREGVRLIVLHTVALCLVAWVGVALVVWWALS